MIDVEVFLEKGLVGLSLSDAQMDLVRKKARDTVRFYVEKLEETGACREQVDCTKLVHIDGILNGISVAFELIELQVNATRHLNAALKNKGMH